MTIAVHLTLDRRERVTLQRSATLRGIDDLPVDIQINDISSSGCLIRCDSSLDLGEIVSLGIPGIGVRAACVMRAEAGHYGCAFEKYLSGDQIVLANKHNPLVEGLFPNSADQGLPALVPDQTIPEFSSRRRLAMIACCGVAAWMLACGAALAIL
jgi:hypothetical protein